MADQNLTPEEAIKQIEDATKFTPLLDQLLNKTLELGEAARALNSTFLQGRERASEMMRAIADAGPQVLRLGGQVSDALSVMQGISKSLGRNIIASADEVGKLYAAQKLVGKSAEDLVKIFANIGVQFTQIGPQLLDSIKYVQSIGGNASDVMTKVVNSADQLNRYQFEGGVVGLTKMAAQASMLRFDMSQTFQFAENLYKPDKAIEVASAFQRLGVSAGNLVDPFELMNQSINDPEGLQTSLINIGKQFTYFDEKTKSFKINPQGVLTLKEIEAQTGVSAKELSKAGLAAAELDARLSQISPRIKFEKEEDKQFLSNIATMREGKYQVEVTDEKNQKIYKDLGDVTQEEINKLIQQQKDGPKTLEDIQRSQLSTSQTILGDVNAIKQSILGGLASTDVATRNLAGGQRAVRTVGGAISKNATDTGFARQQGNELVGTIGQFIENLVKGKKSFGEALKEAGESAKLQTQELKDKTIDVIQKTYNDIIKNSPGKSDSELENLINKAVIGAGKYGGLSNTSNQNAQPIERSSLLYGTNVVESAQAIKSASVNKTENINQKIDYSGTVTFKVDTPPGVSAQYLNEILNSEQFKEKVYSYVEEKNKELEKSKR
jgi:hypothetical protein